MFYCGFKGVLRLFQQCFKFFFQGCLIDVSKGVFGVVQRYLRMLQRIHIYGYKDALMDDFTVSKNCLKIFQRVFKDVTGYFSGF